MGIVNKDDFPMDYYLNNTLDIISRKNVRASGVLKGLGYTRKHYPTILSTKMLYSYLEVSVKMNWKMSQNS